MKGGFRASRYSGDPFAQAKKDAEKTVPDAADVTQCCEGTKEHFAADAHCCHTHEIGGEGA